MRQQVQGAGRGADPARSYSQVLGGGSQAAMTKQRKRPTIHVCDLIVADDMFAL